MYVHVSKYRCSEASCGLQLSYNIGKTNIFLRFIWNVFGLRPFPISAFSHYAGPRPAFGDRGLQCQLHTDNVLKAQIDKY